MSEEAKLAALQLFNEKKDLFSIESIKQIVLAQVAAVYKTDLGSWDCYLDLCQNGVVIDIDAISLLFPAKFGYVAILEQTDTQIHNLTFQYVHKEKQSVQFQVKKGKQFDFFWNQLKSRINLGGFHQKFQAVCKLGQGGFASVYVAKKKNSGFDYAVKAFVKDQVYSKPKGKQGLSNQISILRQLRNMNNPNIVRLEQIYQTKNSMYFVFQLLKGGILTFRKLDKPRCLDVMRQLEKAGIVHLDIKPQNIVFKHFDLKGESEMNQVALIDFGFATRVAEEPLYSKCGTPGFMAPQILSGQKPYKPTCKSDMFSLGAVFFALLTGRPLFKLVEQSTHQSSPRSQERTRKYQAILQLNRKCSFSLEDSKDKLGQEQLQLLKGMLQTDAEKRLSPKQALSLPLFNKGRSSLPPQEGLDNPQLRVGP